MGTMLAAAFTAMTTSVASNGMKRFMAAISLATSAEDIRRHH
jgi:hypothetical protein